MSNYELVQSYAIKKLSITNIDRGLEVDLSFIFESCTIFHSMDDLVTSGVLVITEQGSLPNFLPVVGRERIDIEFTMMNGGYEPYKRSFWVYAVDNVKESGTVKSYNIHFTDICGIINNNNRLSMKYEGKVESIFDSISKTKMFTDLEYLGKFADRNPALQFNFKTETAYDVLFVAPNWKPLQFMRKLANKAVSVEGQSLFNDCLFYQQVDGKYEFDNYHRIFSNQTKKELNFSPNQLKEDSLSGVPRSTGKYNIENYNFNTLFNTQAEKMNGMLGTTIEVLNFLKNEHNVVEQTYDQTYNQLNNSGYFGGNAMSKKMSQLVSSNKASVFYALLGFNDIQGTTAQQVETEQLAPIFTNGIPCNNLQNVVRASFELSCGIDLRLGELVEVKNVGTNLVQNWIKGTWCVSKIRHTLTQEKVYTYIECFSNMHNDVVSESNRGSSDTRTTT